jgi:hypothetical protein
MSEPNRFGKYWAPISAALFQDPIFALVTVALAFGAIAWRVFWHFADALWAMQAPVDRSTITSWALGALEPDGAEAIALLALVLSATVLLCATAHLLRVASPRVRAWVAGLSLLGAVVLARHAQFVVPLPDSRGSLAQSCLTLSIALGSSALLGWGPRRGGWLFAAAAVLLVPLTFIPASPTSALDAEVILAPALRLLHGVKASHVYMQYDYLPSAIMEVWLWLGGRGTGLFFVVALSYYGMFVGLFVLARRWLAHPGLAGPLLVAVVIVRIYALICDEVAVPQVSPLRLDLWLIPVAVALRYGLRHRAVALAFGLIWIVSRSIGLLLVGGYALALAADFLGARLALSKADRPPFGQDLARFLRGLVPHALIFAVSLVLLTVIFGGPVAETLLLYRHIGVGMTRIVSTSFYWWLLPVNAFTAALAFWRRGQLGEKRAGATLLASGLLISSSLYFFGRSHENNLINLSVGFLCSVFLSLDMMLLRLPRASLIRIPTQVTLSLAIVGLCAWQYSGRIWDKARAQVGFVSRTDTTPPLVPGYGLPKMYCHEIARAVTDSKVYFFSENDYFLYEECGYVPHGYWQPMWIAVLKAPLVAELNQLLDRGFTIALPKAGSPTPGFFADFLPWLGTPRATVTSESEHYQFVKRASEEEPRRRPRRPRPGARPH